VSDHGQPRLVVHAGDVSRHSPMVTAAISPDALVAGGLGAALPPGPLAGYSEGGACLLREEGADAAPIVGQYDAAAERLYVVVPGAMVPGSSRTFVAASDVQPLPHARYPVTLTTRLDRVQFLVGGQPFATYLIHGGRRPYFWPVIGPSGASIVRGQGTAEHPHHTGMGVSYGGHSEGGSSNIWSDWDEPPYGPGGRLLHRGFRRVTSGPVYGELVEDLTYVNAHGDAFAEEIRTTRCWWASHDARYLDIRTEILRSIDSGPQPFLFMIRLPGFFDIPSTGRVTNSVQYPVPPAVPGQREYRAAWVDGSGPTGGPPPAPPTAPPESLVDLPGTRREKEGPATGPWNGIALFDHPENNGYPNIVGKYAVVQQITQAHYPPASAPRGPFTFQHRIYIHDGDAEAASVAARHADYAVPCVAELRHT